MDKENKEKEDFKVIICGSREFSDYEFLKMKCDKILAKKKETHEIIIISGAARGADSLGERYAIENNFKLIRIPANWDKYGKKAGYLRNEKMAKLGNACIGFLIPGIDCKGTKNMLKIAREKQLVVREIEYKDADNI